MEKKMGKAKNIIKIRKLNLKEFILMIKFKEKANSIMKMGVSTLVNLKMVKKME